MRLSENFEKTGNWFFRQRGLLPFLILPIVFSALQDSEAIERIFGDTAQTLWEIFCITLSFSGLLTRVLTVGWIQQGTSGRNTEGQLADALNTQGMYSLMRHPLYFGNFLITFAMILFIEVWWLAVIFVLAFWLFYERIMFAEEAFLERSFGDRFKAWASETPAFFPDFKHWKRPASRFSWRMVLRREYSTFFGIITGFVILKFFTELIGEREFEFRSFWLVSFLIGFAVYITLRTLRKKTQLLNIAAPPQR